MKCTVTDHGMGVMLIMRGPQGFSGGKVIDGIVSQIDLYPTLCELAGIEAPLWLEGRSIVPLVNGEAKEINEVIFGEVNYHAAYQPQRAVRSSRWKYIRHYNERLSTVLPNIDDGPSKQLWLANGLRERTVEREQLFDLMYDPNEANNLAGNLAYAAQLEDMRGRLNRWMMATDDPLLFGSVPRPVETVVNPFDDANPGDVEADLPPGAWFTRKRYDQLRSG